jgi:hypothetical protein
MQRSCFNQYYQYMYVGNILNHSKILIQSRQNLSKILVNDGIIFARSWLVECLQDRVKIMASSRWNLGKITARSWKIMAGSCQDWNKIIAQSWQALGEILARYCQDCNKIMVQSWQDIVFTKCCQVLGRSCMATSWETCIKIYFLQCCTILARKYENDKVLPRIILDKILARSSKACKILQDLVRSAIRSCKICYKILPRCSTWRCM